MRRFLPLLLLPLMIPFSTAFAEEAIEGGFGQGMGMDFYSQIERGHYTIQQKLIKSRLSDFSSAEEFTRGCPQIAKFRPGAQITQEVLDTVDHGDYSKLMPLLDTASSSAGLSTDQLSSLANCLISRRSRLIASVDEQASDMYSIASIGVYTDGSTENSDYDIISDIGKLNSVIFSTDIPYAGTKNIAQANIIDLLLGKKPAPLFPPETGSGGHGTGSGGSTGSGTTGSGGSSGSGSTTGSLHLGNSLASGWCGSGASFPFSGADMGLIDAIDDLYGNGSTSQGGGYSAPSPTASGGSGATSVSPLALPALPDFLDKSKCEPKTTEGKNFSLTLKFCVTVDFVPSSMGMGGGRTDSIESLLEKRLSEMSEISQYDLASQIMTTGFFQSPKPGFQLWKNIAGMRTYIYDKPNQHKTFAGEENRQAVLDRQWKCAASRAGLVSTDPIRGNTWLGQGYMNTEGSDTDTILPRSIPLDPLDKLSIHPDPLCLARETTQARTQYYETFSQELDEVQTFTDSIIAEIEKATAQVDMLEKKGTQR